jgi:hypothetical protein
MPAKAGIQQGLAETLDSRLRGNDKMIGCDSIESAEPYPTISLPEKNCAISCAAVSGASEP